MDLKQKLEEQKKSSIVRSLQDRMDTDRKLVDLEKYILRDVKSNKIDNAISITLSDAATFAWNVEAGLGAASEQAVVESEDKTLDTAYVEDFIRAVLKSIDMRLTSQGRFRLDPFLDQQMTRRGRGAGRCWVTWNGKELVPDVVGWDTRFMYHEMSSDGMEWAGYETIRTKDMVLAKYPEAAVEKDTATVSDLWGKEQNIILVDNKQVKEQKNRYGIVPVCYQMVPLGSMLADEDSFVHHGESIFFLIRDLIPELNRLVSVIQSLNQKALDNALVYKNVLGTEGTRIKADEATAPGATTAIGVQESLGPIEFGEIKRSAYLLHQIIETRIQRGSLSNFDYGTFSQPMSAVALVEIGEGRDQVFLPRLGARGLLKKQLVEMLIDQVIMSGMTTVEVGTRGHMRTFDVRKLQGEYEIDFKYFIKSPKTDIARIQVAAAAGDMLSEETKLKEIYQVEDYEEEMRRKRRERARQLFPILEQNDVIKAMFEEGERGDKDAQFNAEVASAVMGISLEKLMAGEVQVPQSQEKQQPEQLVPLTPRGRLSSQAKSAQLQAEPREEE